MAEIEHQLSARAQTTAIAALEVVPFAMLIADASAHALSVNTKWVGLSDLGRAESLGNGWLTVLDPDDRERLREEVLRVAREGGVASMDHQIRVAAHKRWVRWWASRHELEGTPLLAIAAADIDDDYARQANLYHLATHDALTGLVNRSHFIECIEQALRRSARQHRRVAVVYVDLDGFKRVNDRGGHSLGDRVLYAIAARLRHAVRAADLVARIGGDEFAVLCEGLNAADQADVVARRIALALTESVELDGERWSVAASVGAAVDHGDPDNAESLVDRADRAMYSVKLGRRPAGGDASRDRRRADYEPEEGYGGGVAAPPRPAESPRWDPADESGRFGLLDPDEARRALRDLAEAAGAFSSLPGVSHEHAGARVATHAPPPAPAPAPAAHDDATRNRLAADVVNLRESIDSIRRMLDRLLSSDSGIIDIRDV
jgi:diguanylate cyclase (GGDEF)-like protein/PAS domain S-box-containing protein